MEKAYHVSHICHFRFPVDAHKQTKKASELILIIHFKLSPSKILSFQYVVNIKQLMAYVPFFFILSFESWCVFYTFSTSQSQTGFISCVQQPPVACGCCPGQQL